MITTPTTLYYRSNGANPKLLPPDARLTEAARLLATAILRLKKKRKTEKFPLDNSPNQCPHVSDRIQPFGERP
ncbi:MAG: hypothetical protein H7839_20770 [Magnetococcus sp. YQC-5]